MKYLVLCSLLLSGCSSQPFGPQTVQQHCVATCINMYASFAGSNPTLYFLGESIRQQCIKTCILKYTK